MAEIKKIEEGMTGKQVADLLDDNFKALNEDISSGSGMTVDSSLSLNSANPVENKVITEELQMLQSKIDGISIVDNPFIGYFDSAGKLPARTEPAWALAGDLATAKPYAYYVAGNIPIGYVAGWNDLSATLGTYDFTELANYVSKNEMFNVIRGKNLCNPEDLKAGVYLNSSGGTQNGDSYAVTGFIPINEGETLCCNRTISSVACNVLYAADKTTVIAAFQNSASQILTWQEGASFARFSIQNNLSNVQVEVGN
mgnify:FL=1